jgi:acyl-CoA thioesterase I
VSFRTLSAVLLAILWLAGCGGQAADPDRAAEGRASAPATPVPTSVPDPAPKPKGPSIIFLGDSLTAGLGLDVAQSFPALIQQKLATGGYGYAVVNAGVSGDTSAGGLRRLDWAMGEGDPKILVVALGGNDGLRGLPPEQLEQNLSAIIERGQERGLRVILAGMEAPPNFGADYTARFRAVYKAVAERHAVRLIPFLLDGVAGNAALNQPDGIHPNSRGAELVADLVWRTLQPELEQASATTAR